MWGRSSNWSRGRPRAHNPKVAGSNPARATTDIVQHGPVFIVALRDSRATCGARGAESDQLPSGPGTHACLTRTLGSRPPGPSDMTSLSLERARETIFCQRL